MAIGILMLGLSGQVAVEIQRLAGPDIRILAFGRKQADLSDPEHCAVAIAGADVDIVINAAAFTSVDEAEKREDFATVINGEAPGQMAEACAARNLPFIHISTDYVFDGSKKEPWVEDDTTAPINAYGRSKLAGERAIRDADGEHVILRTSWLFSSRGHNFVKTMLHLGEKGQPVSVVDDQFGGPTAASDLALALFSIAKAFSAGKGVTGTFHFCGTPAISWHGFAENIFDQVDWLPRPALKKILSSERVTMTARPQNSVLDCTKILDAYDIAQPDWRNSLASVLGELRRQYVT